MSEDTKSATAGEQQDEATRRGKAEKEQSAEPGKGEGAGTQGDRARTRPEEESGQAGQEAESAGGDTDVESLAAQLEAAQAEIAEHKDRYMRAAAEADNIRRRAENDIASARKFAIEGFASEILSVRDSLEIARSLEINEGDSDAVAKMKEGLDLTLKQLDSALSKFSIETIDPQKGDKLDPERHQAMSTQESDNVPPNHILSVIQKGYTIHDRLLRPAMVVVAKKPEAGEQTGESGAEG